MEDKKNIGSINDLLEACKELVIESDEAERRMRDLLSNPI
jgi:hypothetical protein